MRHASQVAQNHAETMIKGHWNAEPIAVGQAHPFTHPETVVKNIMVGEHRALGKAGRAGSVLDVDNIVEVERRLALGEFAGRYQLGPRNKLAPGQHSSLRLVPEKDGVPQVRELLRVQDMPRVRRAQFRNQFAQHPRVVVVLETLAADQCVALRLAQGELKFIEAVGGVDRDENRADFGSSELRHDPGRAVGGPDADPLALLHAQPQQRPRDAIHLHKKLCISEPTIFEDRNQGLIGGKFGRDFVEQLADGLTDKWHGRDSVCVARFHR